MLSASGPTPPWDFDVSINHHPTYVAQAELVVQPPDTFPVYIVSNRRLILDIRCLQHVATHCHHSRSFFERCQALELERISVLRSICFFVYLGFIL
ncbi:hypothetical protein Hypma_003637 [Hypsizygus marmoreus]|uniref:Uncharacterized protein n=1 Tax=Hypsizygus marmoreus TaxID=39966 RepID=A0A369J174_HYPMA|nr:hypothetical protein Hypma_003637 [Hypsizygus marmoreus]